MLCVFTKNEELTKMKRPFFRKIAAAALALTVFAGYTAVAPSELMPDIGITAYAEETTLTVCDGDVVNSYVPVYGFYADAYLVSQCIYPAAYLADMNGGTNSKLCYYIALSSYKVWDPATFQVYITETTATTISAFQNFGTMVYEGGLNGTQSTMEIPLSTEYTYNGGNLLISVLCTQPGYYDSVSFLGVGSTGSSVQGYSYTSLSAINPTPRNFLPKLTFTYESATKATAVNLDKTTAALTVGDTDSLTATVLPDDATDKTVTWSSDNDAVVSVTDLGNGSCNINALGEGTATITATATNGTPDTADDITATCTVTVAAKAAAVNLDKTTAALTVGDTDSLTATVLPDDAADKTVTWTSSDDTVVSGTDLGNGSCNINALGEGTATITATATNGTPDTADDITAACTVTVAASVSPEPTHTWGGTSYQWSLNNNIVIATYRCIDDPSLTIKETAYTTSEVTMQPTATTWGETTYTAVFTDPVFTTQRKAVQDIPPVAPAPAPAPVYPDYDPYFVPSYTPAGSAPVFVSPAPYHSPIEGRHIRSRYDGKGNIILSWDEVDIADDYIVYLIQNGKAKKLTTTDDLSYTYTGAKAGTSYTFMVKYHAGSSVSRASESYRTTVKTAGKKPIVTAAVNDGYILLTWDKVTNAEEYAVYQQNENGRLKKLGTTTDTSFRVDTVPGETYTFAVKAYVDGEWTTVNRSDLVYVTAE